MIKQTGLSQNGSFFCPFFRFGWGGESEKDIKQAQMLNDVSSTAVHVVFWCSQNNFHVSSTFNFGYCDMTNF